MPISDVRISFGSDWAPSPYPFFNVMLHNFIATIVDASTGEVYGQSKPFLWSSDMDSRVFDDWFNRWSSSYKRGLQTKRNLHFSVQCTSYNPPVQGELF